MANAARYAAIQTLGETVTRQAHRFHSASKATGSESQTTCGSASNSWHLLQACALVTAGPPYNDWIAGVVSSRRKLFWVARQKAMGFSESAASNTCLAIEWWG